MSNLIKQISKLNGLDVEYLEKDLDKRLLQGKDLSDEECMFKLNTLSQKISPELLEKIVKIFYEDMESPTSVIVQSVEKLKALREKEDKTIN